MSRKEFIDKYVDPVAREEFIQANAVALVTELEAKVERRVRELRKQTKANQSRRKVIRQLVAEIDNLKQYIAGMEKASAILYEKLVAAADVAGKAKS